MELETMAYILAIIKWLFARIVGGWLLKQGKYIWRKHLNNPESRFYHLTIRKAVKNFWFAIKIFIFIKFTLLLLRMGLGRNIGKETSEKIVIALVMIVLCIVAIPMYLEMQRKRKEAEPVLF